MTGAGKLATCDVDYYKWEQWIFLKMYEKGLVYRKNSPVNYCVKCQTVLANEQVEDGACWRCGEEVVQKELVQWFFAITRYADELNEYCDKLPGWPEKVLSMQKNWIGKSYGVEVNFTVEDGTPLTIFTTRPDTLWGVTFMVLAPDHPRSLELAQGNPSGERGQGLHRESREAGQELQRRDKHRKGRGFYRQIRDQSGKRR